MLRIDVQQIDVAHRHLSSALRRWEEDKNPEMEHALQSTAAQTQGQLQAWTRMDVYGGQQMQLLQDLVQHVQARMEQVRQEATRGY